MEVMDQLAANPVSTTDPTAVGASTLTMAEEEQLSRRSVELFYLSCTHSQLSLSLSLSLSLCRLAALRQPN